jgi:hypothetical protein
MAHQPGDKNRSGRVERPFHYIENNFYPGRTFDAYCEHHVAAQRSQRRHAQ